MALSSIRSARLFKHTTISGWSEHCLYALNIIRKPETSGVEDGGPSELAMHIVQPKTVNLHMNKKKKKQTGVKNYIIYYPFNKNSN